MIIRVVRMHFKGEDESKFLELFERNEEAIRNFPGCRKMEMLKDVDQPHTYVTISEWEGVENLEAYRKSELFGSIWPNVKKFFASKPLAFTVQDRKQ